MRLFASLTLALLQIIAQTSAFNTPLRQGVKATTTTTSLQKSTSLFPQPRHHTNPTPSQLLASASALSPPSDNSKAFKDGFFTFKTKYGKLNPYAIFYGLTSILLGLPWFVALTFCQILYKVTGGKVDKMRRLPIFFSHVWGVVLMKLTRSSPEVVGQEILNKFYKE